VAVVQYTFTHKKYIEQHKEKKYIEQHKEKKYIEQHIIDAKQYPEQHSSLIRKNADRAPSLQCIP